jgi:hypothetical protein
MMARIDNNQRRSRVSSARKLVYEMNLRINGAAVERLLREMSLVPIVVCDASQNMFLINATTHCEF